MDSRTGPQEEYDGTGSGQELSAPGSHQPEYPLTPARSPLLSLLYSRYVNGEGPSGCRFFITWGANDAPCGGVRGVVLAAHPAMDDAGKRMESQGLVVTGNRIMSAPGIW